MRGGVVFGEDAGAVVRGHDENRVDGEEREGAWHFVCSFFCPSLQLMSCGNMVKVVECVDCGVDMFWTCRIVAASALWLSRDDWSTL